MTKEEFCKEYNITERQFVGEDKIEGYLYLDSLTSIPDGFNPTVGGHLYLGSLTSIPEGFNPTVGGSLDLRSLTSIPEGFNPTVGGSLYTNGLDCDCTKLGDNPITWGDKYIKVDGIFTEIVSKRGNVYRVKEINKDKVFYFVTDGNGKWAHGDTLKQAREDLVYKLNKHIDKSAYEDMTLDTKISFEEAVVCYRVITGACSFGVKDFVSKNNIKKKRHSISEIIELTRGSYGNQEFENYFNK